jgi:TRAP-type uncharacterized transport system fused permease subunit
MGPWPSWARSARLYLFIFYHRIADRVGAPIQTDYVVAIAA